jgi:hypothetical protein
LVPFSIGASQPRPMPKSANRLSISSPKRRMNANGVAANSVRSSLLFCNAFVWVLPFLFLVVLVCFAMLSPLFIWQVVVDAVPRSILCVAFAYSYVLARSPSAQKDSDFGERVRLRVRLVQVQCRHASHPAIGARNFQSFLVASQLN